MSGKETGRRQRKIELGSTKDATQVGQVHRGRFAYYCHNKLKQKIWVQTLHCNDWRLNFLEHLKFNHRLTVLPES